MTDYLSLCVLIVSLSLSSRLCWLGRVSQQTLSKAVNLPQMQPIHDCLWIGHQSLVQSAGTKVSGLVSLRDHSCNFMLEELVWATLQKRGLQVWHNPSAS